MYSASFHRLDGLLFLLQHPPLPSSFLTLTCLLRENNGACNQRYHRSRIIQAVLHQIGKFICPTNCNTAKYVYLNFAAFFRQISILSSPMHPGKPSRRQMQENNQDEISEYCRTWIDQPLRGDGQAVNKRNTGNTAKLRRGMHLPKVN